MSKRSLFMLVIFLFTMGMVLLVNTGKAQEDENKPNPKHTYKPLTVNKVKDGFESRSTQASIRALAMAKFAGRMEEAEKCPCSTVKVSNEKDMVRVEISYERCENGENIEEK